MSSIKIVKGYPISLLVTVKNNGSAINVNDGTWAISVNLHYQTPNGPTPFTITPTATGNQVSIDLDSDHTSQLNHLGTGYLLVIQATTLDQSVVIKNSVPVSVVNGI